MQDKITRQDRPPVKKTISTLGLTTKVVSDFLTARLIHDNYNVIYNSDVRLRKILIETNDKRFYNMQYDVFIYKK